MEAGRPRPGLTRRLADARQGGTRRGASCHDRILFRDDAYLAEAEAVVTAAGAEGDRARPHALLRQLRRPARRHRAADLRRGPRGRRHRRRAPGRRPRAGAPPARGRGRAAAAGGDGGAAARLGAPLPADADAQRAASPVGGAALRGDRRVRSARTRAASISTCPSRPRTWRRSRRGSTSYVAAGLPISAEWISEEELAARPEMVKTMKVKPPVGPGAGAAGQDRRRTIDLQPCGGTHVRSTAEIGPLRIGKIEKKGRENRRVNLHFAE